MHASLNLTPRHLVCLAREGSPPWALGDVGATAPPFNELSVADPAQKGLKETSESKRADPDLESHSPGKK